MLTFYHLHRLHPVDKVIVNTDGSVVFSFKNDSDIILKI